MITLYWTHQQHMLHGTGGEYWYISDYYLDETGKSFQDYWKGVVRPAMMQRPHPGLPFFASKINEDSDEHANAWGVQYAGLPHILHRINQGAFNRKGV